MSYIIIDLRITIRDPIKVYMEVNLKIISVLDDHAVQISSLTFQTYTEHKKRPKTESCVTSEETGFYDEHILPIRTD